MVHLCSGGTATKSNLLHVKFHFFVCFLQATSPQIPHLRSSSCNPGSKQVEADACLSCQESQLELDKLSTKCDHLASQNSLLNLSLEETKSTTEKLTVLLGKHEANMSAMQMAVGYSDSIIEAYDVLVALLEASDKPRRRLAAENVAKHLLSRPEVMAKVRSDSGMSGSVAGPSLDTTWDTEYSSGYSQTTASSSSTNSSSPGDNPGSRPTHQELKVYLAGMKTKF